MFVHSSKKVVHCNCICASSNFVEEKDPKKIAEQFFSLNKHHNFFMLALLRRALFGNIKSIFQTYNTSINFYNFFLQEVFDPQSLITVVKLLTYNSTGPWRPTSTNIFILMVWPPELRQTRFKIKLIPARTQTPSGPQIFVFA